MGMKDDTLMVDQGLDNPVVFQYVSHKSLAKHTINEQAIPMFLLTSPLSRSYGRRLWRGWDEYTVRLKYSV